MSIGANIRRIRMDRGITQVWLAEQVGVTQSLICQIEKGLKNPSLAIGAEIAKNLDCKIEDLTTDQAG